MLAGTSQTERAGFFNQLRETFDAFFRFSPRNEIAKAPNDLAGANRLLGGTIQGAFYFRPVGIGTGGKKSARALHVIADRGERLIEFVRERRCHLSHRTQTGNMNEFGLQFLKPRLCLLMFGQISDKSGEIGNPARLHFTDRKMHRKRGSVLALTGYDSSNADNMTLASGKIPGQIAVVA